MYERSAIVLERYFEKLFGFEKENNLKLNFNNYKDLIGEIKKYQEVLSEEEIIIKEFEKTANIIQDLQSKQEKLHISNEKNEDERNKIFHDLDIDAKTVEELVERIENNLDDNNKKLKKIREEYVEALEDFNTKQKQRKVSAKKKRLAEKEYFAKIESINKIFESLNYKDVLDLQNFVEADKEEIKKEIENIMIKNGKNEKVGFNKEVIKKAVEVRTDIAVREANCYISVYEKNKRLLQEISNDNVKLNKYEKLLRDVTVKLLFLDAEKEYIVSFLDNERMTAINGLKAHRELMKDACINFDNDIAQINNLYELLLRETTGKSTKKAYRELYNKTYFKEIEEKEKNFEQETNKIKLKMGAVINYNYWRIDGIKNIYHVFQDEITEKFEKDLSEFRIEEPEDENIDKEMEEMTKEIEETENKDVQDGYIIQDESDEFEEEIEEEELNNQDEDLEDYEEETEVKIYKLPKNKKQREKIKKLIKNSRKQTVNKKTTKKEVKQQTKQNKNGIFNKFFKK